MENGVKDCIEQFNWQRDYMDQEIPSVMRPYLNEVKQFTDFVHQDILYKIYRRQSCLYNHSLLVKALRFPLVFALALELPIDTFEKLHRFEERDDSWFRCECSFELDRTMS